MEEGTKTKKTIFVGGIGDDVDEGVLLETFSTFGDVIEVQVPPAATNPSQPAEAKHRGFAFVTFSSPADAQDAIDNMDMNELNGRVLKVNLARQVKAPTEGLGNRAIWESEEWLQHYAKPLSRSGGAALRAKAREGSNGAAPAEEEQKDEEDAMEE
ncbi:RNA-binding domain-containing protein [Wolfiporia cocos MD-104 SS10]|uniref:RNA-binding domain-containing protein n=1 Tax=Wolfiporia cocos (strain MD-104) TaxID=742152 RepID=A0A2H3J733_WOLCO|nr:RNA-binding domain-containing protein [Wolfiporia cocos MD-104 SS10]